MNKRQKTQIIEIQIRIKSVDVVEEYIDNTIILNEALLENINISLQTSYNAVSVADRAFATIHKVVFYDKRKQKDENIISLATKIVYQFHEDTWENLFDTKENILNIPSSTFNDIDLSSLGALRGALVVLLRATSFKELIIPLTYAPSEIAENFTIDFNQTEK